MKRGSGERREIGRELKLGWKIIIIQVRMITNSLEELTCPHPPLHK